MVRKSWIALLAGSGLAIAATTGTASAAKPTGGIWSDNSPGKSSAKPKTSGTKKVEPAEPMPGEAAAAANADATVDAKGDATVDANASANANPQVPAGANSQGAANANLGAVAKANDNSALAAGAVASSALPGLTTGLSVKDSAGASLGTVNQVVTGEDGSIRLVVINGADGKTHRLMPDKLSISGGVVTTTEIAVGG